MHPTRGAVASCRMKCRTRGRFTISTLMAHRVLPGGSESSEPKRRRCLVAPSTTCRFCVPSWPMARTWFSGMSLIPPNASFRSAGAGTFATKRTAFHEVAFRTKTKSWSSGESRPEFYDSVSLASRDELARGLAACVRVSPEEVARRAAHWESVRDEIVEACSSEWTQSRRVVACVCCAGALTSLSKPACSNHGPTKATQAFQSNCASGHAERRRRRPAEGSRAELGSNVA